MGCGWFLRLQKRTVQGRLHRAPHASSEFIVRGWRPGSTAKLLRESFEDVCPCIFRCSLHTEEGIKERKADVRIINDSEGGGCGGRVSDSRPFCGEAIGYMQIISVACQVDLRTHRWHSIFDCYREGLHNFRHGVPVCESGLERDVESANKRSSFCQQYAQS